VKHNIMFVDDSISVLESLQWVFKDEPYYLFAFDNPFDALRVIKTLEWAVVVVERNMPNLDGLKFLKMVRQSSPHTMGIIMADYTETKEVLGKLYPDCAFQVVKKPFDNTQIRKAVKKAVENYEINAETKRHEFLNLETF
jgi:two-component system probable response regulator PhcQ